MKRTISGSIAALLLVNTLPAFAAEGDGSAAGNVGVLVAPGMGTNRTGGNTGIYNKDGSYNFNQVTEDINGIAKQLLDQNKIAADIDRDYLKTLSEKYNSQLKELADLKAKFTKLSVDSSIGRDAKVDAKGADAAMSRYVTLREYADLVILINNKDQILKNDLATLSNLTRESLPSYSPLEIDGKKISTVTSGNVKTDILVSKVDGVRAQLIADMNALQFRNLRAAKSQFKDVLANALTLDLAGVSILEQSERADLTNKMMGLRILSDDTVKLQRMMVQKTVSVINKFMTNYGTSETLRFPDQASEASPDAKALQESFLDISDAFMRRSYIRKKYGIRVGAIQSRDYNKSALKWERYGLQYQPLKVAVGAIRPEAAIEQEDVKAAFENARQFMELYEEKTRTLFGSQPETKTDKYSSANSGLFSRINSAVTTLTGQRPTAEVLRMIMTLVLADAREEMMMFRNANDELAAFHDSRFRSTAADKTTYAKEVCQMDWVLFDGPNGPEAFKKNCAPLGIKNQPTPVNTMRVSSIADIFSQILVQYKNVEQGKWFEAANIQRQLDADLQSGKSAQQIEDEKARQSQDLDDVFGK